MCNNLSVPLQERLQTLQDRAGFVETELREQLAEARAAAAAERRQRQAAAAAEAAAATELQRRADRACAELDALRHQARTNALTSMQDSLLLPRSGPPLCGAGPAAPP